MKTVGNFIIHTQFVEVQKLNARQKLNVIQKLNANCGNPESECKLS